MRCSAVLLVFSLESILGKSLAIGSVVYRDNQAYQHDDQPDQIEISNSDYDIGSSGSGQGSPIGTPQIALADKLPSDYWVAPSVVSCRTSDEGGRPVTSRSAMVRSEMTGHRVTLHTSQSVQHDIGSSSRHTILCDHNPIFRMSSSISNEGIYAANITWNDLVAGASYANYTVGTNGNLKGSINGQPFRPFFAINASRSTFDNGESFPRLSTPPSVDLSMVNTVPRLAAIIGECPIDDSHVESALRRRASIKCDVHSCKARVHHSFCIKLGNCLRYWNEPVILLPCTATEVAVFAFGIGSCHSSGSCS